MWYISPSVYSIFDFFHQCLIVFCIHLFVYLGNFIPRHFIIYIAVMNGIHSLISLSHFSFLVYGNASDFCVLILYPATLLNSLVSSSNVLITLLEFSMYIFHFPGLKESILWKIILPNVTYKFSAITIKLPITFFTELEQIISQFVWRHKRTWKAKEILKKKNEARGINCPGVRLHYKDTVIKTVWYITKTEIYTNGIT